MTKLPFDIEEIFSIKEEATFEQLAMSIFHFQYENNLVYREYVDLIRPKKKKIENSSQIPFLPIRFFKTHQVKSYTGAHDLVFQSSGTGNSIRSQHYVKDISVYEKSFIAGIQSFIPLNEQPIILGLLPNYIENGDSSLVYMVKGLIEKFGHEKSGFFLYDHQELRRIIQENPTQPKLLFGVSYALMDFGATLNFTPENLMILETGGMKGRRKELTKQELHNIIKQDFRVPCVYSEYGMTELLSQAYSLGDEIFECPPWMQIKIREYQDPFNYVSNGKSGGINVIDLANIYSCSFIETEDLGRCIGKKFEVLGRFDHAEIRGCNLMIQ